MRVCGLVSSGLELEFSAVSCEYGNENLGFVKGTFIGYVSEYLLFKAKSVSCS